MTLMSQATGIVHRTIDLSWHTWATADDGSTRGPTACRLVVGPDVLTPESKRLVTCLWCVVGAFR